jgi:phosphoribosyl-ATP pyrophosphohydrolase
VASLFRKGPDTILKKVAEEAAEVILSCKNGDSERIISEVADLFFHALVAMGYYKVSPADIYRELGKRFGKSGLRQQGEEKRL